VIIKMTKTFLQPFGASLMIMCLVAACTPTQDNTAQSPNSYATPKADTEQTPSPKMDHTKIVRGNGENNFIILDGTTRDGNRFTVPEIGISQPGFLVVHPFRNGKPVPTEYVGAVPVKTGMNKDVSITLDTNVQRGDMFIVMLHYDMNTDGIFDFGDGVNVPDVPVFEGHTLVALRYAAP